MMLINLNKKPFALYKMKECIHLYTPFSDTYTEILKWKSNELQRYKEYNDNNNWFAIFLLQIAIFILIV